MGMAAGQARLLSITTRMSDNELRAQLINNDKMRLATKSAQVSEAYTTALNDAQMMFTNYDADNKTSYQELTYNSLTAYNPYNNQYAISNSSGQVLVSEKDATNFKNANGDLNTFLKSYGLEYSTDYFSSLINTNIKTATSDIKSGEKVLVKEGTPYLKYKTDYVDNEGNSVDGYIQFADAFAGEVGGANLAEVLQNLYNGVDKIHPGYDTTKSSIDYLNYSGDLADYIKNRETMMSLVNDKMLNTLNDFSINNGSVTYKSLYDSIIGGTCGKAELENLSKIIGDKNSKTGLYGFATSDGAKYLENLQKLVDDNKGDFINFPYSDGTLKYSHDAISGATTLTYEAQEDATDGENEVSDNLTFVKKGTAFYEMVLESVDTSEPFVTSNKTIKGVLNGNQVIYEYYMNEDGNIKDFSSAEDAANNGYATHKISIPTSLFSKDKYDVANGNNIKDANEIKNIVYSEKNTSDNMKEVGVQVIKAIQNAITNIWDIAASDGKNGAFSKFTDAQVSDGSFETYLTSAKKLYKEMFGNDIVNISPSSDDILYNMDKIEDLRKAIEANATDAKKNSFKKIYDVYILDCVMNTYGEPKFTWIDKNDKNQNGETKAQWYTNLFNRMKTGGYKTLQDGLASSTEWIKFAFESGLVTLEQVDGSNTWNSTTYSNCSDITEQTNNTAITIAEAEYNAQMNKIQNKDKMYDLELKNIDTEHNSLQVEYESIKGAIDKNIERTFKIYS